jgi:NAD(P)-dependent dehydrogenase (short-subunit alcohol dehydrogenase family)
MSAMPRGVAVVTGAGGTGCGRAIAARFASRGDAVVVSDINEPGGRETVEQILLAGGTAEFFRADVRHDSQTRDLISFAEATFGAVSVLVNNASAPEGAGVESSTGPIRWRRISWAPCMQVVGRSRRCVARAAALS